MIRLATTILLHQTRTGPHYDLLIQTPPDVAHDPTKPLWAARVALPPHTWNTSQTLTLKPLPGHRSLYLDYEGPLSGDRGYVQRVDRGYTVSHLWTPQTLDVTLQTTQLSSRWRFQRFGPGSWRGVAYTDANAP